MIDTLDLFAAQVTSVAKEVGVEGKLGGQAEVPGAAGTWKSLVENVNQLAANLTNQVRAIADVATAVTKGDLSRSVKVEARGEVAELKDNVNEMIRNLRDTTQKNTEQDWLKTNLARFTRLLQGQKDLNNVSRMVLSELAPLVNAKHGLFYIVDSSKESVMLKMLSGYAFKERKHLSTQYRVGEGLVGQCAYEKERILLTNVPGDYIQISSGLGEGTPLNIIVLPVLFEGQVKAVIELAAFERFSQIHQAFLEQLTESIGIVLNTIEANMRTEELLKQSQSLAEELQSQQEELKQTNEELEEKAKLLEEQKTEVERKNTEVEDAKQALEEKARQLALTSKYKSEFLSNMSHELRTPLNSLLILARQLQDNPDGNLSEKQVDFAKTIYGSGNDLLNLINEILDLSKIESGTVSLDLSEVKISDIKDFIDRTFRHVAVEKDLEFNLKSAPDAPESIYTDHKRLQQVLKNLLSNAFKFTPKGKVEMNISLARSGWSPDNASLNSADKVIAFAVSDTGIGIPKEKQQIIFEAFQQAEGGTSRKYGGTGLGLSISREIAKILGGEIKLLSEVNKGSTFILYLPVTLAPASSMPDEEITPPQPETRTITEPVKPARVAKKAGKARAEAVSEISDDRAQISPNDKSVLIVEDDVKFAKILLDCAHQKGYRGIVELGGENVLQVAKKYQPSAITLDIVLPDIDGWTVLDRLKMDTDTRHIPVHIITVKDERNYGLSRGAISYLEKPVSAEKLQEEFEKIKAFNLKPTRDLLIVEDNPADLKAITELLSSSEINITAVDNGNKALAALKSKTFDCMLLDLMLPDISGFKVLEQIEKIPAAGELPIIIYTGKSLTKKEVSQLEKFAKRIVVKGVQSPERLLNEVTLFLHQVASKLPKAKRKILEKLYQTDTVLAGKKVLVVDDDMRNIFALTSILERHQLLVMSAENGKEALKLLENTKDVDAILMDIMMPEMDGYETTRNIRKMANFKNIPIIALTAKAMKGDREKCLEAGASDYISKPVNMDQLLSLLRVWLYK